MKRNGGYYVGKYLKENGLVLLCELLVVLLLGIICSILLKAEPLWLAPVMAVVAYFLAEIRFTMAYVAKNVNRDRELNGDGEDDEDDEDDENDQERHSIRTTQRAQAEDEEDADEPEFHAPTVHHFDTIGMDEEDPMALGGGEDDVFAEPEMPGEAIDEPEAMSDETYDATAPEVTEVSGEGIGYEQPAAPAADTDQTLEEQPADADDAGKQEQDRGIYDANRIIGLE